MDKRRLEVSTGTSGIATLFIDMDFTKGQAVNIHGYRAAVSIEPENADANCNGIMGIYVLPAGLVQNSDLPSNYGEFGNDDNIGSYTWGIMPFTASNQTPFNWEFAPKTSRNMQVGGRIVLEIFIQGVSAGNVRTNTTQTCFTSPLK